METRLSVALSSQREPTVAAPPAPIPEVIEAVTPSEVNPAALLENGANVWPDESAESAFLSERGEEATPASPLIAAELSEDDEQPLPALDELVKKIPAGVRTVMDELFRAKFITVRRVPKKALKE